MDEPFSGSETPIGVPVLKVFDLEEFRLVASVCGSFTEAVQEMAQSVLMRHDAVAWYVAYAGSFTCCWVPATLATVSQTPELLSSRSNK